MTVEKLTNLKVISGQIIYPTLSNKMNEKEYAKAKVHMWLYMLNEGKKPTKWLKPNTKGTKVNFDFIHGQEDYEVGLQELILFTDQMNTLHSLDYKIKKSE